MSIYTHDDREWWELKNPIFGVYAESAEEAHEIFMDLCRMLNKKAEWCDSVEIDYPGGKADFADYWKRA